MIMTRSAPAWEHRCSSVSAYTENRRASCFQGFEGPGQVCGRLSARDTGAE